MGIRISLSHLRGEQEPHMTDLAAAKAFAWPAHAHETRPWKQTFRGGSAVNRKLREITVWLPPTIAERDLCCSPALSALMEDALREIAALDTTHGMHLGALGAILLRAESVASSRIEHVEA